MTIIQEIKNMIDEIKEPSEILALDRYLKETLNKLGVSKSKGNPVGEYAEYFRASRRITMKIVAIIASPRGMQGNTGRLLEEVLAGATAAGAETEILSLKELKVQPCVACDICHSTGVCNINDDYEAIKAKLLACDGFILASPNYIFSVTAQLKALFDRCSGLIHCLALEGKYAAVVETSGGGEDEAVLTYMERCVNTLGALSVGGIGSAMAGIRTFPDEVALFARATDLGRELCHAIREKRPLPEQAAFQEGVRARMSGLVDFMQEQWEFERDFWAQKRHSL